MAGYCGEGNLSITPDNEASCSTRRRSGDGKRGIQLPRGSCRLQSRAVQGNLVGPRQPPTRSAVRAWRPQANGAAGRPADMGDRGPGLRDGRRTR
eukprot:6854776-Pyramimonas_sp.AAC.1